MDFEFGACRRAEWAAKAAVLAVPALVWSVVFAAVAGVRPARELLMLEEPNANTNVNLEAAAGALAFLGGGFVAALLTIVFAHALARRKCARAESD